MSWRDMAPFALCFAAVLALAGICAWIEVEEYRAWAEHVRGCR